MKSYKKLGKNVFLLTLGNFASKILTFLLVPFYTAYLTTEQYGTADLITSTVNLIMPIFTLLMYEAVMRYALDNENFAQIFSWGIYITIVGSFLVTAASPILLLFTDLKAHVHLFVLYYVSLAFYNLILQFAKGIEKVGVFSIAGVLNTLIYVGCNLLFLIVFEMKIDGYLYSSIISHFVTSVYVFIAINAYKFIIPIKRLAKSQFVLMVRYSCPMIPNAISWWLSNSSSKLILTAFWDTSANGLFSVAYKIPSILTLIVSIFISAWQISAVENFGSDESKRFYEDVYDKYSGLLFLTCSALIVITKPLSALLFSGEFFAAWVIIPMLIYAFVFNSFASFYGSIYTSAKKTKMLFYSTLLGAGLNIALSLALVPKFGTLGAAFATIVSYFAIYIMRMIDTKKILPIKTHWKRDILANVIIIIEIIVVMIDRNYYFIPSIVCALLVCVLCRRIISEIVKTALGVIKGIKHNKESL